MRALLFLKNIKKEEFSTAKFENLQPEYNITPIEPNNESSNWSDNLSKHFKNPFKTKDLTDKKINLKLQNLLQSI